MNIYQAVIASTYGRGSPCPLRAACIRLAGLWAGAAMLSLVLASSLVDTPNADKTNLYLTYSATLVIQIIVLFTLISSHAIGIRNLDTLARILIVLPLRDTQRWLVHLLPSLLLSGLALSLVTWPIAVIFSKLGLPPLFFLISVITGTVTAFGVVYGALFKYRRFYHAAVPLLLWFEYQAVSQLTTQGSSNKFIMASLLTCLFTCLAFLFFRGKLWLASEVASSTQDTALHASALPMDFWFFKKLIRTRSVRSSFAVAFLLSVVLAWACDKQQLTASYIPAAAACLMAASCASDIRAVCRRSNPSEIVMLRGTAHFIKQYATMSVLVSFLSTTPFMIAAMRVQTTAPILGLSCLGLLGACIGTFCSTLLIPQPRDVTSQFSATLVCIVLIALCLKISGNNILSIRALLGEIGSAMLCLLATFLIEYKRNQYQWRKPLVTKK